jgi:hypothetical protein
MTLLPLHVAFVWILNVNPRILRLGFAAMTIGALVPDIEPVIAYTLGASVFCGWNFPCTEAPDRLVLHSLLGAVTVDVALTFFFVKLIGLLRPERFGVHGFSGVKMSGTFYASAAIGSVSHVLIDWLHHVANPVFWPLMVGNPPSYYVEGLLTPFMSVLAASFLIAVVAAAILIFIAIRAFGKTTYTFSQLIFNPALAASVITESLTSKNA